MASNDDIELLTEHFGYPPVSLLDDIINAVNLLAEKALTSVEQGLGNAPPKSLGFGKRLPPPPAPPPAPAPPKSKSRRAQKQHQEALATAAAAAAAWVDEAQRRREQAVPTTDDAIHAAARLEIEHGTHQLETLLCASIDRNFDKLELWAMQNVLCIAPVDRAWIRLAHYHGLDFEPAPAGADADAKPSLESIVRLRRRLHASQQLHAALHAEHARNAALLAQLRPLLRGGVGNPIKTEDGAAQPQPPQPPPASLAFLRASLPAADAAAPIATTAAFALSQLASLRALAGALGEMQLGADGGGEGSARAERVAYIEGATRRHLERARALELDAQGAVRDGDWQGEGRRVERADVEGLERVLAGLEGGGGEEEEGGEQMDLS